VSYDSRLPGLFPVCVVLEEWQLAEKLSVLLAPDAVFPNGSSFAVTVDTERGMRKLWLSQARAKRLGL